MSCRLLETERLLLRLPQAGDVAAIVALAGDFDVARNLATMPHPYNEADAESWIERANGEDRATGKHFMYAIARKEDGVYMGACGLHLRDNGLFELGYWLGRPYWGQGYATEAAKKLSAFAFSGLKAARITAGYFHDNPASGRVLEKVGFRPDGSCQRACLARGHAVYCLDMLLEREHFGRRRAA